MTSETIEALEKRAELCASCRQMDGCYTCTKNTLSSEEILTAIREWKRCEKALRAHLEPNEPLTLKRFEEICESVHNGWWEEKKRQGITRHPDMLPYSELAEEVKEYDRVTVRRVLDALGIPYRRKPEQED